MNEQKRDLFDSVDEKYINELMCDSLEHMKRKNRILRTINMVIPVVLFVLIVVYVSVILVPGNREITDNMLNEEKIIYVCDAAMIITDDVLQNEKRTFEKLEKVYVIYEEKNGSDHNVNEQNKYENMNYTVDQKNRELLKMLYDLSFGEGNGHIQFVDPSYGMTSFDIYVVYCFADDEVNIKYAEYCKNKRQSL